MAGHFVLRNIKSNQLGQAIALGYVKWDTVLYHEDGGVGWTPDSRYMLRRMLSNKFIYYPTVKGTPLKRLDDYEWLEADPKADVKAKDKAKAEAAADAKAEAAEAEAADAKAAKAGGGNEKQQQHLISEAEKAIERATDARNKALPPNHTFGRNMLPPHRYLTFSSVSKESIGDDKYNAWLSSFKTWFYNIGEHNFLRLHGKGINRPDFHKNVTAQDRDPKEQFIEQLKNGNVSVEIYFHNSYEMT